jgi:hypothetical protein
MFRSISSDETCGARKCPKKIVNDLSSVIDLSSAILELPLFLFRSKRFSIISFTSTLLLSGLDTPIEHSACFRRECSFLPFFAVPGDLSLPQPRLSISGRLAKTASG